MRRLNANDEEMKSISTVKQNTSIAENVDICVTLVGNKPPVLPLREERLSQGVECIYNAKGTAQAVVAKEKSDRLAELFKQLNHLEKKLKTMSPLKRRKKKKSLAMLAELRLKLEESARDTGLSYESYIQELLRHKRASEEKSDRLSGEGNSSDVLVEIEAHIENSLFNLETDDVSDCTYPSSDIESQHEDLSVMTPRTLDMNLESDLDKTFVRSELELRDKGKPFDKHDAAHNETQNSVTFSKTPKRRLEKTPSDRTLSSFVTSLSLMSAETYLVSNTTGTSGDVDPPTTKYLPLYPSKQNKSMRSDPQSSNEEVLFSDREERESLDQLDEPENQTTAEDLLVQNDSFTDRLSRARALLDNALNLKKNAFGGKSDCPTASADDANDSCNGYDLLKSDDQFKGRESRYYQGKFNLENTTSSTTETCYQTQLDNIKRDLNAVKNNALKIENELAITNKSEVNLSRYAMNDKYPTSLPPPPIRKTVSCHIGRYQLFVTEACPWSHRTLVARSLKGLEDVIGVSFVKCKWKAQLPHNLGSRDRDSVIGRWIISNDESGKDDQNGAVWCLKLHNYLSKKDLSHSESANTDIVTVPILWDRLQNTIVSSNSSEIMLMINSDFNKMAKRSLLNLYPHNKQKEIDLVNEWINRDVNLGVYRCGLAISQQVYEEAIGNLTKSLDKLEILLKDQRFLTGDELTVADINLFVTLIRFDDIYRLLFKANTRRISKMPSLLSYVREIYQISLGVADSCDIDKFRAHYFGSCLDLNPTMIVPRDSGLTQLLSEIPWV